MRSPDRKMGPNCRKMGRESGTDQGVTGHPQEGGIGGKLRDRAHLGQAGQKEESGWGAVFTGERI